MNLINELKKKIIQNKKFIFNNKNHDLVDELKKKRHPKQQYFRCI